MHKNKETIAAIATPAGRGGVGIIRISGNEAPKIAQMILGQLPKPRKAVYIPFYSSVGEAIDEGIALFFPAPHSFTGEDVLELQAHGGPVILDILLQHVLIAGARLARPGEFSERAFLNGKLDLVQAEAIADLIDASSELAARCALRSLQGEFSLQVKQIIEQLIQLRIFIEAAIDFPTEEIDFISESSVNLDLLSLITNLETLHRLTHQGTLLREGMNAVIVGKPNAGKSSLLNSLSGRDSAIVTEIPGTTRDVLREFIQIDGMPLHIIDTAGLRETDDIVEQEGVRRTKTVMGQADVILWIVDAREELTKKSQIEIETKVPVVIIHNKIDLIKEEPSIRRDQKNVIISVSAKFQQGLDLLKNHLKQLMGFTNLGEGIFTARRRHLHALDKALDHLRNARIQFQCHQAAELLAEDLRQAQQSLSEITGDFSADDLLGKIFSSFCIGK